MNRVNFLISFLVLVVLLFSACANQGVPSGGSKDVTPPEIIGTYPPNKSVNFKSDKIIIQLDEFANLTNPFERVVISPPLSKGLEFNSKGKKLEINIPDTLRENTTYVMNFTNAIEDVTERNKISNYQYVFSTGSHIDSLMVSGKVIESYTKEPTKEVLVMLYDSGDDSAFYKQKPVYFGKTDGSGSFSINYVKPGEYQLVALEDQNFSYSYDVPSERIAFNKEPVVITPETNEPFELMLYQEEDTRQALRSNSTDIPGIIQFIYKQPVEDFSLTFLNSDSLPLTDTIIRYSERKDSVSIYYTKATERDVRVAISPGNGATDTLFLLDLLTSTEDLPAFKATIQPRGGKLDLFGGFKLIVNQPLKKVDLNSINIYKDSFSTKETVVKELLKDPLKPLIVKHKWRPNTRYDLVITPSAFMNNLGRANDSITVSVVTKRKEDYGFLTLILNGLVIDTYYILELVNDQDAVVSKKMGTGKQLQTTQHPSLVQEKLRVRIISDANNNGKWDPGSYSEKRSPESVFLGNEKIDIRANWESEIEINIIP